MMMAVKIRRGLSSETGVTYTDDDAVGEMALALLLTATLAARKLGVFRKQQSVKAAARGVKRKRALRNVALARHRKS